MTTSQNDVNLRDLIAPSFYTLHRDMKAGAHTHYWIAGGRGSTKSSFAGIEIPLGIMRDAVKGLMTHAVVLRRYGITLRESVYEQIVWGINALGVSHLWQMNVSPMKLTYLPTGQTIIFRGVDDATKIKSLKVGRGYVKYVWFEEVTEFEGPEKLRNVLQSLLRGGSEFTVIYSFNPPQSLKNWVNSHVAAIETTPEKYPDAISHHSDYRTVPREWLGEQFIAEAEQLAETNPKAYHHELLGEVTGTGGEVFENVKLRRISDEDVKSFDRVYNGVDWGYYPDPWAFNKMHFDAARRTLYIFIEEHAHKKSNRDTAAVVLKHIRPNEIVTCDSAENKSVQDYRAFGINYARGAIKGPGSVDYSMKWLQSLSAIIIDPVRCPHTAKEFSEYEHERTKDGEIIDGYPDVGNHHIDAVRYALEQVWRRRGK